MLKQHVVGRAVRLDQRFPRMGGKVVPHLVELIRPQPFLTFVRAVDVADRPPEDLRWDRLAEVLAQAGRRVVRDAENP